MYSKQFAYNQEWTLKNFLWDFLIKVLTVLEGRCIWTRRKCKITKWAYHTQCPNQFYIGCWGFVLTCNKKHQITFIFCEKKLSVHIAWYRICCIFLVFLLLVFLHQYTVAFTNYNWRLWCSSKNLQQNCILYVSLYDPCNLYDNINNKDHLFTSHPMKFEDWVKSYSSYQLEIFSTLRSR